MSARSTILLHGKIDTFCSFSLVNRRLIEGLRRLGHVVQVVPGDRLVEAPPRVGVPDVYIAHDYPHDWTDAPGRFNVFVLVHEYFRLFREERTLVDRLNACFDLLVVPSRFTRRAARRSGVKIPILLCPWGVDHAEFCPTAPPVPLRTRKRFRFVYVGGAFERKGTDVLVRAFREEFTASEDVALIIKAFSYEWRRTWIDGVLRDGERPGRGPEIEYLHGVTPSVAGYYTAAAVGVFPYRGEGFGLPILECLASGTTVIVTRGGAADDFCSRTNARFIRARRKTTEGRAHLEPDRRDLRRLMRAAFRRGAPDAASRARISASVAGLTWTRTARRLSRAIEAGLAATRRGPAGWPLNGREPAVVWAHWTRDGGGADGAIAAHVDRAFRRRFPRYHGLDHRSGPWRGPVRAVVAEAGHALEHFLAARRTSPDAPRLLVCGDVPLPVAVRLSDLEKVRCGVRLRPQLLLRPMRLWRYAQERRLAHATVAWSRVSRRWLRALGSGDRPPHVVEPGAPGRAVPFRRPVRSLRFLFVSPDPFRDGVRLVLEAWDRLRPARAELLCVVPAEVTESARLIRYLVRHPAIRILDPLPRRRLRQLYPSVDCLLLPSLGNGAPLPVLEAMGAGRPAIVSTSTAAADLVSHGQSGYVVRTGSVTDLVEGLARLLDRPRRCVELGDAAFDTARRYTWRRFEHAMGELVTSLLNGR